MPDREGPRVLAVFDAANRAVSGELALVGGQCLVQQHLQVGLVAQSPTPRQRASLLQVLQRQLDRDVLGRSRHPQERSGLRGEILAGANGGPHFATRAAEREGVRAAARLPFGLLDTEVGTAQVQDVLGRIEYGIVA